MIKDCPTEVMWADILTKPLQGKAFREMRAILMNCPSDYIDELDARLQQRGIAKSEGVDPKKAGAKRQKAPVKRERMHRSDRCAQECVGQVLRDTKRVSWDPKVREKIFWDSLPYRTQYRRRLRPRGPGGPSQ